MSEYLLEKAKTCYHCKPLVDENEILSRKLTALEAENERLREVAEALGSINRGRNNLVPESVTGDDEPCYWQRKEWIDWILDLADKALRGEDV